MAIHGDFAQLDLARDLRQQCKNSLTWIEVHLQLHILILGHQRT